MTNNELLTADLLDILFDGRNKAYGAYALRRNYNRRMRIALAMGLALILLFIIATSFTKKERDRVERKDMGTVIIRPFEIITDVPKKPEPVLPRPRRIEPPSQVATIVNNTIKIVDDKRVDYTMVPENADIAGKEIGPESLEGQPFDGTGTLSGKQDVVGGNGGEMPIVAEPALPSSAPEFPGGPEALQKFLGRHLQTPEDLELGDKKMVRVRFIVDKDGSVSRVDIETSGGDAFDREVIRVCRKMPKWKPAIQNGHPVTTSYVLPVTFMSGER